jgi:hypothetical protein
MKELIYPFIPGRGIDTIDCRESGEIAFQKG